MGGDRSAYLLIALAVAGVIAPATAVFWFMNEAVSSQAEAARRSVADAYRTQLNLMRERADEWWTSRAASLDQSYRSGLAIDLPSILKSTGADAVILLDAGGTTLYPKFTTPQSRYKLFNRAEWAHAADLEADPASLTNGAGAWRALADTERDGSLSAIAAQAHIRSLVRKGDREAALAAIHRYFGGKAAPARGRDREGRHIAADEYLLALRLMKPSDPRFAVMAERLAALLNDYQGVEMPSAQRAFLMRELWELAPSRSPFPTFEAERLAIEYLERAKPRLGDTALQASPIRDVWTLTSPSSRVVALYRTGTIIAATVGVLGIKNASGSVSFVLVPPGLAAKGDAIAAGGMLPGWQISFALLDNRALDEAARARKGVYLLIGSTVMAALALSGLILGRLFRRQMRLTRLKTDLVSAVSHELKTPLASMRLLVDSLLEDGHFDTERTQEYLVLISAENARLSRLIENFLTFSRIDRNRQTFVRERLDPGQVMEQALGAFRERAKQVGYELKVDVSPDLPVIYADRDALTTAMLNLLDNAWKYSGAKKRISVQAFRDNGHVVLSVSDNGNGIPARERKKIFRPFYQVDRRLARHTGGCGLGLSIVDFIVRAHGGAVRVESEPGAGSTFSVRLPCAHAESES